MKHTLDINEEAAASEMAIVDTFTKLIFGDESPYTDDEQRIIAALREVDAKAVAGCQSNGCLNDLGAYLRALGVGEMIALVRQVRTCMAQMSCSNLRRPPSHGVLLPSALSPIH